VLDKLPGLLQGQWTDDADQNKAIQRGLLGTAFQLLGARGGFGENVGRAGMAGMGMYEQALQEGTNRKRAQLQQQMLEQQMADAKRARDMQAARSKALQGAFTPARPGMGPPDAAGNMPAGTPGGFDWNALAKGLTDAGDVEGALPILQSMKKDTTPIKAGADDTLLDPQTFQPVWQGAGKPKEQPSSVREYEFARGQGYKGTYAQWDREQRAASRPSVSVNTGQQGFKNTLDLRGDFRSEPTYKAFQETHAAHSQIKQALAQASPAGDLAGATKIMKILDPGSVVRESELGMAMAASGLLDRMQNYATNVIKGTKLTPTQRQDFQTLADALYGEAVKAYNAKRGEYEGIAQRNGLHALDVLGPAPTFNAAPQPKPGATPPGGGPAAGKVMRFDASGNLIPG
jgi:hypothetical protein